MRFLQHRVCAVPEYARTAGAVIFLKRADAAIPESGKAAYYFNYTNGCLNVFQEAYDIYN